MDPLLVETTCTIHVFVQVIATCRNPSAAKELNDLLAKYSQPEAVQLDVADHGSIKAAYEKVKGITPALDILINNAGEEKLARLCLSVH